MADDDKDKKKKTPFAKKDDKPLSDTKQKATDKDKASAIKNSKKFEKGDDDKGDDKRPNFGKGQDDKPEKGAAPQGKPNLNKTKDDDQEKEIPKVNPKKFVLINPDVETDGNNTNQATIVSEGVSQTKVDYLIRLGLGDQDELTYYRQAMMNPKRAIATPNLRPYVADLLAKFLDIMFSDNQIYTRVTTVLKSDLPSKAKEKRLGESLLRKARKADLDPDVITEVFKRGLLESGDQESAFNRVNSFIANGAARKMDADLLPKPDTFSLIKKALRK